MNRFKWGRAIESFKQKEGENASGLGMSVLSKFSHNVVSNSFSCGVVNGVEGGSSVAGGQKCSPCLVYSDVYS